MKKIKKLNAKKPKMAALGDTLLNLMEDFVYLAKKVNSLDEEVKDPEAKLKLQHTLRHLSKLEDRFSKLVEGLERIGIIDKPLYLELMDSSKIYHKENRRKNEKRK